MEIIKIMIHGLMIHMLIVDLVLVIMVVKQNVKVQLDQKIFLYLM